MYVLHSSHTYYIYEYIFDNYKCIPYFDYEYELDKIPLTQDLITNQTNINKHIKSVFKELFKINKITFVIQTITSK